MVEYIYKSAFVGLLVRIKRTVRLFVVGTVSREVSTVQRCGKSGTLLPVHIVRKCL